MMKRKREEERIQGFYEAVRGAAHHGPGAWVHRKYIPTIHDSFFIYHLAFH
jgi:hypothetical protein